MRNVNYTKTGDNRFNLLLATAVLGEIARVEAAVPAKREGKTRKGVLYTFTPAAGVELKGEAKPTMKELKAAVAAQLPEVAEAPAEGGEMPSVEADADLE